MRDSSQIWERGQLVDVCSAPFHFTRCRGHGASQSLVGAKKIDANVAQQLEKQACVLGHTAKMSSSYIELFSYIHSAKIVQLLYSMASFGWFRENYLIQAAT